MDSFRHRSTPTPSVLFVASVFTHLSTFHVPFMRVLQDWGYQVHAAAAFDGTEEQLRDQNVVCWNVSFRRSPYSPSNLRAARELSALFRSIRFSLVHLHTPVAALIGRYVAARTGQGPALYTAHGFHFYRGAPIRNWVLYRTAERIARRWTKAIIVINDEDYTSARLLGYRPGEDLYHSHGVGVDIGTFAPSSDANRSGYVRESLNIPPDAFVVACVAELNQNKNHGLLLDAWATVGRSLPNSHLLIVGQGKLLDSLSERVQTEHLAGVHLLGQRTDVAKIMAESDVITLVSRREGRPRVIMEAMAAGKPVVATDVRGSRDLVQPGETGLLVPLSNTAALCSALVSLAIDPDRRARMGEKARDAIRPFDLPNVLHEVCAVYQKLLSEDI